MKIERHPFRVDEKSGGDGLCTICKLPVNHAVHKRAPVALQASVEPKVRK